MLAIWSKALGVVVDVTLSADDTLHDEIELWTAVK